MKRFAMTVVGILLALAVATPMVFAQPNGTPPQPVDETSFELPPLGDPNAIAAACEFPVRVQFSGKAKTIELPGDRTIFTSPGLNVTLTNVDEPENQVTLNVTGALHQTVLENGDVVTVATGRNLLGDPEAGFVLAKGRFSFVFDAEGNLIQPLSGKGKLIDVCELLS